MTLQRMDNMVDDLEAMKAFFAELGMELEWETTVEGPAVDRLIGLENVRVIPPVVDSNCPSRVKRHLVKLQGAAAWS